MIVDPGPPKTIPLRAAGVVILLYDHLLTFDDEVELIWKGEWRFPKLMFLFIRYIVAIIPDEKLVRDRTIITIAISN
ncbi:hypothetical protein MPER_12126, partial [Moniliophthora perniciosa FA553]